MSGDAKAIQIANLSRALKELQGEPVYRQFKSSHMRKVVLKILNMSPEERAAYVPKNGFEEMGKNLVGASAKGKDGQIAIQAWKEVTETLGERIGPSKAKADDERERKNSNSIIVDMPQPEPRSVMPDLNEN